MDVTLEFEQRRMGASTVRFVRLQCPLLPPLLASEGYFFELVEQDNVPEPRVLDGFMLIFLQFAMQHARRYFVRGPLSARCMRNAQIYQEAWHRWLPDDLRPVEIIPDKILAEHEFPHAKNGRAIGSFSGGVDATFLALRHARQYLGASSYKLDTVVTVHGYDFPLSNAAAFDSMLKRTDPLLKQLGLNRRIIRTNIRAFELHHWELVYGAHVACALHQFSHDFEYGLLGSSAPYNFMINTWGSTPATDYLLSGDDLEIVHDGARFSRTEKIGYITKTPSAVSSLSVCWEGQQDNGNCGVCEKCIRTRLNFLAVGVPEPDCFNVPLDLKSLETVHVSKFFMVELMSLLDHARKNGINAPWVDAVHRRVEQAKAET